MPRQNRVTPFGEIIADPGRGLLMGNRGILHDAAQRIVRPWAGRAWIICQLDFRGRKRQLMQPGRYTELFFLDEATALAAGHRPCAECRRAAFNAYRAALAATTGALLSARDIDRQLNAARLMWQPNKRRRQQRRLPADFATLPAGAMVTDGADAYLWHGGALRRWSPGGYGPAQPVAAGVAYACLTPAPSVAALAGGYVPVVHRSAVG